MTSHRSSASAAGGLAAIVGAVAVLAAGAIVLPQVEIGPLSLQMTLHLAVMNVAAPLAAAALAGRIATGLLNRPFVWTAACGQIVLLWAWHAPAMQHMAAGSMTWHLLMLGSMVAAGLLFWVAVVGTAAKARWDGVLALLLTGKLACLLGALLIFSPRALYQLQGPAALEDQQLAGLLMITACPLSYVVAGVVLAAQAIGELERRNPLTAG